MYEKACSAATVLFFALCMALSIRHMVSESLSFFGICWNACFLLLYGGCLALLASRRPVFPARVCRDALWFLTLFLVPWPFALDGPDMEFLALSLPRLFAVSFAAAVAYSLLYVLAEQQRGAGTSAAEETSQSSATRLSTGKRAGACLLAFLAGLDAFLKLIDLARLAASAQP